MSDEIIRALHAMERTTPDEKKHLAEQPHIVYVDGKPAGVFPPHPRPSLEDWVKMNLWSDGHEASAEEVTGYLNGGKVGNDQQAPVVDVDPADEWNAEAPPESPATDQPATPSQAPVAEPSPAPKVRVSLGPEYELLRYIDDDHAEVLWADPSQPRNGKRKIVVDLRKLRKQQAHVPAPKHRAENRLSF